MNQIGHFKVWGVYVLGGICPRGYVSGGVSVQGVSDLGVYVLWVSIRGVHVGGGGGVVLSPCWFPAFQWVTRVSGHCIS